MKKYCGVLKRVLAWLFDVIFQLILFGGIGALLYMTGVLPVFEIERLKELYISWSFLKIVCITMIAFSFLYGWFFEVLPCHATLGKMIMGIKVTRVNDSKAKGIDILTRNLVKQIPFLGFYLAYFFVPEFFYHQKFATLYSLETLKEYVLDYQLLLDLAKELNVVAILKITFAVLLLIKWLWPLFGKKHRAIHDLFAGTVLVNKKYKEDSVIKGGMSQLAVSDFGTAPNEIPFMGQVSNMGNTPNMGQGPAMKSAPDMEQGPFVGSTPDMEQGPVVGSTPDMEQGPVVGSTPDMEQGPVVGSTPDMEHGPAMKSTPVMEHSSVMESAPVMFMPEIEETAELKEKESEEAVEEEAVAKVDEDAKEEVMEEAVAKVDEAATEEVMEETVAKVDEAATEEAKEEAETKVDEAATVEVMEEAVAKVDEAATVEVMEETETEAVEDTVEEEIEEITVEESNETLEEDGVELTSDSFEETGYLKWGNTNDIPSETVFTENTEDFSMKAKAFEETPAETLEEEPIEEAPIEEVPVETLEEQPTEEESIKETPVETLEEEPIEEAPIEEAPVETLEEQPTEEESIKETPAETLEEQPTEEESIKETLVETLEEEPIEEESIKETPAETLEEEPIEEVPIEEAPVEPTENFVETVAQKPALEGLTEKPVALQLHAIRGIYAGGIWKLNMPVVMGRDRNQCNMVFGLNEEGISRVHCRLTPMGEQVLFEDLHSTFGGWFNDVEQICPGQQRMLQIGDNFTIGNLQTFVIERME